MKLLETLRNDYIRYLESLNYSSRTTMNINYNLGYFVKYLLRNFQIENASQLTKKHLTVWQVYIKSKTNSEGIPLKPDTVNKNLKNIKCFIRWLGRKGFLPKNYEDEIEYVKEPTLLPLDVISHGKLKKILEKIDTSTMEGFRDRTILELMYSSGLRASELTGLNVSDIDFDNETVKVKGKFNKERITPIGAQALKFLESYIKGIRPFLATGEEREALFLNIRRPTRLHYKRLLKLVHRHFDENVDINATPHTFRRSCCTSLIKGGGNLVHVKDIMGWESMETIRTYTKLTVMDLKDTLKKCHPREKDK